MPHFRVDDALHSHPKAQRAGDEALGMWLRAGSYCMAYLTDGFVPDWWVKQQPKGTAKARKLVAAGLWHDGAERDGEQGYQFHEFVGPGRQDSREKVEADRELARKRKQKSRRESQRDTPRDENRDTPRDGRGESRRSPGYTQPNPTQPIENSGHQSDDEDLGNARDADDLPPEPPYDPDAEPEPPPRPRDHVPDHIGTAAKPQRAQPSNAARTVVRQVLGTAGLATYPRTFVDRLATQVEKLAREGHPDTLIRDALDAWDRRPDAKPEFLPTVLGDLVKAQRAQPTQPTNKVRGYAELAQQVRAEEQQSLAHTGPKEIR